MVDLEMLKNISLVNGISGFEKQATRVMKSYIEDCVDEIEYDNLGSLIGIKKGTGQLKVLLTGHIDEIGFLVKDIDEQGFIHVIPVGGWMGQNLPSSLVVITTREGNEIKGVFGSMAPHGKTADDRQNHRSQYKRQNHICTEYDGKSKQYQLIDIEYNRRKGKFGQSAVIILPCSKKQGQNHAQGTSAASDEHKGIQKRFAEHMGGHQPLGCHSLVGRHL